ncbi:bcl-2-like protein 1 [Asterias rubens]|uniref:bcl-2-like protein 1 n=1 Tax=Asterias rubens TaxID=7604 RepID=UPI00145540C7|nr:bcl-2-like protein 1 [Asterias rubens]XP_033646753.1 bcl-2-like protein 1 [Asterias rubens]
MPGVTTASVVVDFLHYKSQSNGLECPLIEGLDSYQSSNPMIQDALRKMTSEVEYQYQLRTNGLDMMDILHVTPDTAFSTFHRVVNQIFYNSFNLNVSHNGIQPSWGRIVSLLTFSGNLVIHCIQNEMPQLVQQIAQWTISYIDTYLLGWINSHGGWMGIISPASPLVCWKNILGLAALAGMTALVMLHVHSR